ncbi:MAG: DUF4160 domain-containing protein [Phycisphaerales bacterium]
MPRIWHELGFRFSFYSADGSEPPHVHVTKDNAEAKWCFGTEPPQEARSDDFNAADRSRVARIVAQRREQFLEQWRDRFGA